VPGRLPPRAGENNRLAPPQQRKMIVVDALALYWQCIDQDQSRSTPESSMFAWVSGRLTFINAASSLNYSGIREGFMHALRLGTAMVLFATAYSAMAESKWLESGRLEVPEIRALCERASDVRTLARMQISSAGDERWRRLSRQELVIEVAGMGTPPLNPGRCYVIASAGPAGEREQRAFEVRDFADSPERTSVFVIGRNYDQPPGAANPNR
jgi:hypothetical protein